MNLIFGTDGIRGVANLQISPNLVFFVGKALALNALKQNKNAKILVAKDTRISGDMIFCALSAGIMSVGVDVLNLGVATTPALSFLTKKLECDFGVMITASHNKAEFNGLKFFDRNGIKFENQNEVNLSKTVATIDNYLPSAKTGKLVEVFDRVYDYIDFVLQEFADINVNNKKIALDCANGAGSHIIPYIFKTLFDTCDCFNTSTDGSFINGECGSVDTRAFVDVVKDKYDFGFAFDGDADRLVVVLKNGEVLSGEILLFVLAKYLKSINKLQSNTVVTTILTNIGVENSLLKMGIKTIRTGVGDKFVLQDMLNHNLNLGVENSGHIILGDLNKTSDALIASLFFLRIVLNNNLDITEYIKDLSLFDMKTIDVSVSDRQKACFADGALDLFLQDIESELLDEGRVVVRASGTESVIRILVEGKDKNLVDNIAKKIEQRVLLL